LKFFVTGVYGFIGSCFARMLIEETNHTVVGFGRNTDQRNKGRIKSIISSERFNLINGDLAGDISGLLEGVDVVVHFAAKTFVDHSVKDPEPFVRSNIIGSYQLLEQARIYKPKRFIHISTDEVYGACLEGSYSEDSPLNPTNPYSATKAAADVLATGYFHTYGVNVIITRTENNVGPFQHPQKVLPTFVRKALAGELLPVYGDGKHVRQWLHVKDHCYAVLLLIEKGQIGDIYHIAGSKELQNIELAKMVLKILKKPEDAFEFIPDNEIRPNHDRRYAIDSSKLRALGWEPKFDRDETIRKTVEWYVKNQNWLV